MDPAHIVSLLLTGGVGLWLAQLASKLLQQWLRSKGRIRSEKDALVIARSQWIERYSKLRNSAARGEDLPERETADAYDEWLATHRQPPLA